MPNDGSFACRLAMDRDSCLEWARIVDRTERRVAFVPSGDIRRCNCQKNLASPSAYVELATGHELWVERCQCLAIFWGLVAHKNMVMIRDVSSPIEILAVAEANPDHQQLIIALLRKSAEANDAASH